MAATGAMKHLPVGEADMELARVKAGTSGAHVGPAARAWQPSEEDMPGRAGTGGDLTPGAENEDEAGWQWRCSRL